MKKFSVSMAALALLLTSACGGGGGRPSEGDIADAIKSGDEKVTGIGKVGDKAADCIAKAFHGSKLSDEALRAMVDKDEKFKPSKEDEKAIKDVLPDMLKCMPGMDQLKEQMGDLEGELGDITKELEGLTTE